MYGRKLDPQPLGKGTTVRDLVDNHFFAYNAARLREACQLLAQRVMQPEVTVGVTLVGGAHAHWSGLFVAGAADRWRLHRLDRFDGREPVS